MVEPDVDRATRQHLAVGTGVDQVGRRLEDAEDSPPARDGVLRLGEDLGAHLHRADEQRDQEREGQHATRGHVGGEAEQDADDDDARVGEAGRETAQRERRDGVGLGVGVGPLPVDDRVVDAGLGAVLDAVRAHDGGTHDRLGDRAEQDPHLVADDGVGRGELLLEPADREEQRGEGQPDHRGELPAVEQHQDRRDQHLADAHDEDQSAEDEELADLVDVGGHPRHQGAATLGVLRQQRQVVDVAERLGAERGKAALGGGEEPLRHEVGREAGDQDREGRCHTHPDDESDPWPIGAVEAAVEGLLDGDGHHDLAAGGDDRQDQGPAQPFAQLGRVLHAEPDRLHGGDVLAGVHPGARQGLHDSGELTRGPCGLSDGGA